MTPISFRSITTIEAACIRLNKCLAYNSTHCERFKFSIEDNVLLNSFHLYFNGSQRIRSCIHQDLKLKGRKTLIKRPIHVI